MQWRNAASLGTPRARLQLVVSPRLACLSGRLSMWPRSVSAAWCVVVESGAQGEMVFRLELTVLFAAARRAVFLLPKV